MLNRRLRSLFSNDAHAACLLLRWSSTAVYRAQHGPCSQSKGPCRSLVPCANHPVPSRWPGSRPSDQQMSPLVPGSFSALMTGREPQPYLSGDSWLARIPRLVQESLAQWDLTLDGDPMHGAVALVLPVRRRDDSAAVLKLTWPHPDARHEHLALQHWGGRGAVRLLAANPASWSMLLERLDSGRDLHDVPIDEACTVIGTLLQQLDHEALPQLPHLSAQRQPWLAIDPKPLAADPAFAVTPALWNRWAEAIASGDLRAHLRRRLSI